MEAKVSQRERDMDDPKPVVQWHNILYTIMLPYEKAYQIYNSIEQEVRVDAG